MSNSKFVLNRAGVAELMKSAEMQAVLRDKATAMELLKAAERQAVLRDKAPAIRNQCGDGYEQDIYVGKNRANAMVSAETIKAKRSNAKHNVLLKAVNAAHD